MEPTAEAKYAAFEEKVKRTIYVNNLSPKVSKSVLESTFNQFGNVQSVTFVSNYLEPGNMPRCALVEMKDSEQAKTMISTISQLPFMIYGMPRPVRAYPAEVEMFDDCPMKPGGKTHCRWLDPNDPDFEVAKKLKHLTQKHAAEASFLLKKQLNREEKLHKQQAEALKANFKKLEMIEGAFNDKTAQRLASCYYTRVSDD